MSSSVKYRPDIDGLRAVAVLSVVLFHAGISGFPGGYVGVDVFFVISGYLISKIIFTEIENGSFSIVTFYERRIRRIQPALFAMAAFTVAFFALFFTPIDFKALGQSLAAALLFSSNIYFFVKSGYFDPDSETKPFLHTWSLAVEEQYYVFFPFFAWLMWRYARRQFNAAILVLAAASLAFSIWQLRADADAAFYLPFGRMWELMIGAVLSRGIVPPIRSAVGREIASALGLALIAGGVFLYGPHDAFPGERAIPPCVGAALLLHAGAGGTGRVGGLLALPFMTFVGRISYSLYLWHWPLLVAARYILFREMTAAESAVYLAVVLAFSWASWKWIETPFRSANAGFAIGRNGMFAGTAAFMVAGVAFAIAGQLGRGFPDRFEPAARNYAAGALDTNPDRLTCDRASVERVKAGDLCEIGAPGTAEPSFVLIGDSFGDAIAPGVDAAARAAGRKGYVLTYSGCYPMIGAVRSDGSTAKCADFMVAAVEFIRAHQSIDHVLIVARWTAAVLGTRYGQFASNQAWLLRDDQTVTPSYAENRHVVERGLLRTLDAMGDKQITVIAHIPEQRYDIPRALALSTLFGTPPMVDLPRSEHDKRQALAREVLAKVRAVKPFELIDVGARLCDEQRCITAADGWSLYADDNHLGRRGSIWLADLWGQALAGGQPPQAAAATAAVATALH
ncbi:acyltransferase family protein [Derxia lacustris]|uniref:acyltransferase family protein n=1 Tax=Derxia lacustris TaxID=764842 RepID=UPI000A176A11|nr:acyltransferase family protein [Derxia lacustris]